MATEDQTCPSWCTGCHVDLDGSSIHIAAEVTLARSDDGIGPNVEDARA